MSVDITEFTEIDPDSVHGVFKAANGTPFLMIKQLAEPDDEKDDPDEDAEDATKELLYCGDPTCAVCVSRVAKASLTSSRRSTLPDTDFVFSKQRKYPIHDRSHARNALSRVAQFGSPKQNKKVRAAVRRRYPEINMGQKKKANKASATASQRSKETGSVPSPSAQMGQTHGNHRELPTNKDVQRSEGKPKIPDVGSINGEGDGSGDTASDKSIPRDQAGTQTSERTGELKRRQEASKSADPTVETDPDPNNETPFHGKVNMRGTLMPDHNEAAATGEGQSQTETNMRSKAKKKGGDGIRDQMARQAAQAQKAERKAARDKSAVELLEALKEHIGIKSVTLPQETSAEAMKHAKRLLRALQGVTSWPQATKELENMNAADLDQFLDGRDARKAAAKRDKKKAKKAKAKKAEKKAAKLAKKNDAAKEPEKPEEVAEEATKSASPEMLVDGIAKVVSEKMSDAVKEGMKPFADRILNLENQPARTRPALNNLAGQKPVMRDQDVAAKGSAPFAELAPLEEAFKSEMDPYKKEKLGNELTKARMVIAERKRHGHSPEPVSAQ